MDEKDNNFSRYDQTEEGLYEHHRFTITHGQKPLRIDKFLAARLKHITRSRIKSSMKVGALKVNGKAVKVSYKVKPFDQISVLLPFPPPPESGPEEMPLNIVYEDDQVILLLKPPHLVVHPGIGNHTGTLINGLLWHFKDLPAVSGDTGAVRPGLVHRLDKDTTGLMVIAKTDYAVAHISQQFFDRTTERTYNAIVWGDVKEDAGTIIGNIDRAKRDRRKYQVYPKGDRGRHAVTHFKVLERFGIATLVECKLETGRTHQIRVHFKYKGHTLFSDSFYDGKRQLVGPQTKKFQQFIHNCFEIMPRQALHAKTLGFTHPTTNKFMQFDSELPDDFAGLLEKLRHWAKYH